MQIQNDNACLLNDRQCSSCRQRTKRIEIELERNDSDDRLIFGIFASSQPIKYKAYACEHCGHLQEKPNQPHSRKAGIAIMFFSLLVLLALILLFTTHFFLR